ncbi:hypothetical protein [Nonomuraea longicatena]
MGFLSGLIRPEACLVNHEAFGRLPHMRETACPWPGSTGRSRRRNEDPSHDRRDGSGSARLIQSEAPQVSVTPCLKFNETGQFSTPAGKDLATSVWCVLHTAGLDGLFGEQLVVGSGLGEHHLHPRRC